MWRTIGVLGTALTYYSQYILSLTRVVFIGVSVFSDQELIYCQISFQSDLKRRRLMLFYRAMHYSAKRGLAIAYRPSVCPFVCNVGGSGFRTT